MAGEVRDLSTGSVREPSSRRGTAYEGGCLYSHSRSEKLFLTSDFLAGQGLMTRGSTSRGRGCGCGTHLQTPASVTQALGYVCFRNPNPRIHTIHFLALH